MRRTKQRVPLRPVLFLALGPLLSPAATALQWKNERIVMEADPADEQAVGRFDFTNTGSEPVTILTVRTSCGCTVPNLDKRRYQPGEHGTLEAVFEFGGRTGSQQKTITVTTDEADTTSYQLTLEVEIPKLLQIERHFVIWRRGDAAEAKTIEVRALRPELVKVTGVESRDERFDATWRSTDDPGVYRIAIKPRQTETAVQSAIVVSTDFPKDNPRVITVYGLVR